MPATKDPRYGDKKALADLGLLQRDMPITGGRRIVPHTGRPVGSTTTPQATPAPAPAGVTPQEEALMRDYAEAASAYQWALQQAQQPGAGQWTQFLVQLAKQAHDTAGLALNNSTPNFAPETIAQYGA
jgi:hypothetical protein